MKKCAMCQALREDEEFINEKGKVLKTCGACRERVKVYRELNKEHNKEYKKAWRERNKEKHKEYVKVWYKQNRRRIREYEKTYREQNKEYYREYKREHCKSPAKFSTYADRLTILESPLKGENGAILVKCARCGKYFEPTNQDVQCRIKALNRSSGWEMRIYCSDECKKACEVFKRRVNPTERVTQFERDHKWSKVIKERAGYVCERCGGTTSLEAHHEIPVKISKKFSTDINNGVCLCHECHMKAHSESGCTLVDLRKL